MKRSISALLSLGTLLFSANALAQQEGRFDAQIFRPSAAPRDLVMVQKTEVIGHISPVIGLFYDLAFDPLVIVSADTGQAIEAVTARLTLTGLAGIGLFNWLDLTLAAPFVAWQAGSNLRSIGTEGEVKSPAFGDLRLNVKLALPYLNRKDEVKEGFALSLTGGVDIPTGDPLAFTGNGAFAGGAGLIADYRFDFGLLIALNGGIRLRPERQFAGVLIGDQGSFGVGAEMYIVQSWGLSVVGNLYGYPSIKSYPDDPAQIPAEVLLGLRWQTKYGITVTFGGSFGAACSFGAPAIRFFNSITYQPHTTREQEEINRILEQNTEDPDRDGLIREADRCPDVAGKPENNGCPDQDRDGDGWFDRVDECPDIPAGPRGRNGCPGAFIKGDEIVILDQVHFATDKDIILPESMSVLEEVAKVMVEHREIESLEIEGHTDIRAGDAYNINLSQRRVNSVRQFLMDRGVDGARIKAVGYGHTKPLYDDTGCLGPDEGLTPECKFKTSKNRRVVFKIKTVEQPHGPKPLNMSGTGDTSVLPTNSSNLPKSGTGLPPGQKVLPGSEGGTLPDKGNLPTGGQTLPKSGTVDAPALPKIENVLPKSVLPPSKAPPVKPPAPAPSPAPTPEAPPPPPPQN